MDKTVRSICNNLVNNDHSLRKKGFRTVRELFKKNVYLDDLSLQKLCKGLYYCLWMTDDFIVVHKLSLDIIQLYKHIKLRNLKHLNNYSYNNFKIDMNEVDARLRYLSCLFECVSREWLMLDKNRVDKMLLFTRILVSEVLYYMNDLGWDLMALNKLSELYLNPNVFNQNCLGLWLHFIQIYVNELILNYEHLKNNATEFNNNKQKDNSHTYDKSTHNHKLYTHESRQDMDKNDNENKEDMIDENLNTQEDHSHESSKFNGSAKNTNYNKNINTVNQNAFHELDGVKLLFILKPFVFMFLNSKDQMVLKSIYMYVFKNLEKLSKITNIYVVVHLLQSLFITSNNLNNDNNEDNNEDTRDTSDTTDLESFNTDSLNSNNNNSDEFNYNDNNKDKLDNNDYKTNKPDQKDEDLNTHEDHSHESYMLNDQFHIDLNKNYNKNTFSRLRFNSGVTGANRKYLKNTLKIFKEYLKEKLTISESVHVQHTLYSLFTITRNDNDNDIITNTDIMVELDRLDSEDSFYNDNKMINTNYEDGDTNLDLDVNKNTNTNGYRFLDKKNNTNINNDNNEDNINNNSNTTTLNNNKHNINKLYDEHMFGKDELVLKKELKERQNLVEQDYINLSNVSLQRMSKQRMRNLCILNNTKNYLILVKANDSNSIKFMKKLQDPRIHNQLFYYSLIRLRRLRLMYKFKHDQLNKIYDFNKNIKSNFTINLQQALDNIKNIKPTKSSLIKHDKMSQTEGSSKKRKKKVVFNLKNNQITNIPCRKKKSCNPLALFNLM